MALPPVNVRRGIDPDAARALAESEGLGIPTTPAGAPKPPPASPDKAPKRPAGVESFQADFPADLMDELRIKAIRGKTSVKALVLRALADVGYDVPSEFLEDKRRKGKA
jgi:hypothetical protein